MLALLKLALRHIFRHRGRTSMTLAPVVFGVVSLILAGGFIEDTIVETGESMIRSSTGHVQVARRATGLWLKIPSVFSPPTSFQTVDEARRGRVVPATPLAAH